MCSPRIPPPCSVRPWVCLASERVAYAGVMPQYTDLLGKVVIDRFRP